MGLGICGPHTGPGSGDQGEAGLGYSGGLGLLPGGMAYRVTDWPPFSLQRKASTTSVSCATRCSTPQPSSSVTSLSTASRAWAAPSNALCASQVSVRGVEGMQCLAL